MTAPATGLLDLLRGEPITVSGDLVASAIEHRLGGQLVSALESGAVELSAEDQRTLIVADVARAEHHRRLWAGLVSASDALADLGIAAVAIKGVAEEARWYGRLGQRPCSDIDLVIEPRGLERLPEVMARLGPEHPGAGAVDRLARRRMLQHVHMTWDGVALDLHLDPLKLGLWTKQTDLVFETSTTIDSPDGFAISVLAPELALVGFLTHLNKDRFSYLGAFDDVARIARHPDLDWDLVARFVDGEGLAVPVWKSLAVVVETLHLDVPVPRVSGWRARLWDRLWPPAIRLLGDEGRTRRRQRQAFIPLLSTGRWLEVVAETRRHLLPPKDLLDLHKPGLSNHGVFRRLTIDRVRGTRIP